MGYDLFWRGATTEKMHSLKNVTKQQLMVAFESVLDTKKILKFKVVDNDRIDRDKVYTEK
jgi:hypothetical protein